MQNELIKRAAAHWDQVTQERQVLRTRWWQHPRVVTHINRTICGTPVSGIVGADIRKIREARSGRPAGRGISIGCGSGQKEIALARERVVHDMDLFEISTERVKHGRAAIAAAELSDRVRFHEQTVDFAGAELDGCYELVYWNNALHHMLDVGLALEWSKRALVPGGVLYINDYVGPDRMQFGDDMLAVGSFVRRGLPDRLLENPRRPGTLLSRTVLRPSREAIIAADPTECADSENILPCVRELFPYAAITLTGGAVYHLALNDVLHNFQEEDHELLDSLLLIDEICARGGMTQYGVVVAVV